VTVTVQNTPPVVDAGEDQSVEEGGELQFSGSFTDVGILDTHTATIEWGDGTAEQGTVVPPSGGNAGQVQGSHVYADDGDYTVTVTVSDDDQGTAQSSTTVHVEHVNRSPVADAGGPYDVQEGDGLTLDGRGSTDPDTGCGDSIVKYEWDLDGDDDFDDGEGEQLELTPQAMSALELNDGPAERTIRLRVTDSFGEIDIDESSIRVANVPPQATAAADVSSGLEPLTVTFSAAVNDVPADLPPVFYHWEFDDGGTSTQANPTHVYLESGTYTAKVTVTDKDGDSDSDEVSVTVENAEP
jgi:PKD repeat protein